MNPIAAVLVTGASILNILGMVALLWWMRRRRGENVAETTGHVWDSDLRELNNPLPRWWLWLFLITVVFSLVYLVLYPGLGNYSGVLGWSSASQYREQVQVGEAQLARTFAPFIGQPVETLAANAEAVRIGRNLFLNNCAACHGSDARGAPGFPNLTDRDWIWGGTPAAILETISHGRTAVMPGWRDALGGDAGVEDTLAYVLSLSGRSVPAGDVERGRAKFSTICMACHGADARGNVQLGAPNLTDQTWLYGGSVTAVRASIATGRQGQMPAFLDRLGDTRVRLLAAYVVSLGGVQRPDQPPSPDAASGELEAPPGSGAAR